MRDYLPEGDLRYLNDSGDRWIINGYKARLIVEPDGYHKERTVKHFEQFGNFAIAMFDYRAPDGSRHVVGGFVEDENGTPTVRVRKYRKERDE